MQRRLQGAKARNALFAFRLNKVDAERYRRQLEIQGLTSSEFSRRVILAALDKEEEECKK